MNKILKLNRNEMCVVNSALESFSRLHSGQWDMAFNEVFQWYWKHKFLDGCWKRMQLHNRLFYTILNMLKKYLLNLVPNEGLGVSMTKVSNDMRTAFDIKQVIRTYLNDKRRPIKWDKKNKLICIKKVKNNYVLSMNKCQIKIIRKSLYVYMYIHQGSWRDVFTEIFYVHDSLYKKYVKKIEANNWLFYDWVDILQQLIYDYKFLYPESTVLNGSNITMTVELINEIEELYFKKEVRRVT